MFIFELHSTSDDWLSNPSDESPPKCQKRPPKSSKYEMLIFGLCSTSDDWPSDPSNKSQCGSSVVSVWVFCCSVRVFCCSVWVFYCHYYCLSNSDLVRWCCCHVSSGVIPTPRTHMVGCFCAVTLIWLN